MTSQYLVKLTEEEAGDETGEETGNQLGEEIVGDYEDDDFDPSLVVGDNGGGISTELNELLEKADDVSFLFR